MSAPVRGKSGHWSEDGTRWHWIWMGHKFTIFKRQNSPAYQYEFVCNGSRRAMSLKTPDKATAMERAQGEWKKAQDAPWLPPVPEAPKVVAAVAAVLACYEKHVGTVTDRGIKPAVAKKNAEAVRRVVAWARGKAGTPAKDVDFGAFPMSSFDAALVDAAVSNYYIPAGNDVRAMDSRRRGAAAMIRQARSVFKPEALRMMREKGLHLPDLRSFLTERKVSAPLAVHRSIAPYVLREIDDAARQLKTSDPNLFLAHLLFKFAGLRSSAVAEAVIGCLEKAPPHTPEGEPWNQWFFAYTARGTFRPKASEGMIPLRAEVVAELASVLGDRLDGDPAELDATPILPLSASERRKLVDWKHSEFMRQFLPKGEFSKTSYELRRWSAQTIAAKYGTEASEAFLCHAKKTVAEKHYLLRFYGWRAQCGNDVGISLADARGPEPAKVGETGQWLRGADALRGMRVTST